jgi:hypothetical protein
VVLVERLGEQTYVHLDEPAGQPLVAKAPGDAHIARGERLRVSSRRTAPTCSIRTASRWHAHKFIRAWLPQPEQALRTRPLLLTLHYR